ncbi:MAG TPA: ABC transporter permease [Acidobacteriota bacterium]|nr:ABC transporter permease [Acidobacteriota bacterium]
MKFELFVALRYLRAKRKQAVVSIVTLISIVGVTAGVMALLVALALNTGMQEEFQNRILGVTSHINLLGLGGVPVTGYERLIREMGDLPEVVGLSPTIYGQGLLQSLGREKPAIIKGIDPRHQDTFSDLLTNLQEGSMEGFDVLEPAPPIILGRDLAENLAVSSGEIIRALGVQGELSPLGRMPRVENFRVLAIFESGLWEYDANWALVPLEAAQAFFSLGPEQVSAIEFRIHDIYRAPEVAEKLKEMAGPGFTANTWIELNQPLFSALRLEKLAMFVAIGLIILVASLNIISTLILMVMEKNRDIAIITAMGGTSRTLTRIFMLQGLIIGAVGTVLGDILGVVTVWYLDTYRVFSLEPQVYSIPYVPFRLTWTDMIVVSAVAVLISFVATLYPAKAAAKLDPVEALRYE